MENNIDVVDRQEKEFFKISLSSEEKNTNEDNIVFYTKELFSYAMDHNVIVICDDCYHSSVQLPEKNPKGNMSYTEKTEVLRERMQKGDYFILAERISTKKTMVKAFGRILGDKWEKIDSDAGLDSDVNLNYYEIKVEFFNDYVPDNTRGKKLFKKIKELNHYQNYFTWVPDSGPVISNIPKEHYELFDKMVFMPFFSCSIKQLGFNYEETDTIILDGEITTDKIITSFNIWKVSMSSYQKDRESYKQRKILTIDANTGARGILSEEEKNEITQAEAFKTKMRKGDYFYLCYDGKHVSVLGQIKDDCCNEVVVDGKTRFERNYEIIVDLEKDFNYFEDVKQNTVYKEYSAESWTPSGQTTCYRIPKNRYKIFENILLWPAFHKHLSDLYNGDVEMIDDINSKEESKREKINYPLNQILYGPPGTGKTYNTIKMAVDICDQDSDNVPPADYKGYLKRYNELVEKEKRIQFVTFHQSYGYEDFIEGIKPVMIGNNVGYKVCFGKFKTFCQTAAQNLMYSKQSPEITNKEIKLIEKLKLFLDDAIDKEVIFKLKNGKNTFKVVEFDENTIKLDADADGVEDLKVDSLLKILSSDIEIEKVAEIREALDHKSRFQEDSYYFSLAKSFYEFDVQVIEDEEVVIKKQNYVFIIDEINRGNISKIFGELITLIEESKREGSDEAMSVSLPYDDKPFSVPNNVYIIGTMNTADRSIALMDTALRRRFEFVEMMPEVDLLEDVIIENINIKEMLEKINKRIEYFYDREHTIGHAYFTKLLKKENQNIEVLAEIFKNKVIPLLQEYFYDDYMKIYYILGDNGKKGDDFRFVVDDKAEANKIFINRGLEDEKIFTRNKNQKKYVLNQKMDPYSHPESYIGIYQNKTDEHTDGEGSDDK